MAKHCHWALAGINYKNNDRITACPRGQHSLVEKNEYLPSKIFNNQKFKDVRYMLSKDNFNKHCKSCNDRESAGLVSYRNTANEIWLHKNLYESLSKDGAVPNENLEYVEFRFSNSCNFSCLHCSPEYSSSWAEIQRDLKVVDDDHKFKISQLTDTYKNTNWSNDKVIEVAEDLNKNFPNLKRIDIAGGEPLYQKQFWTFLKIITKHPNISNIGINITSNFNHMVDYEELSKLLEKFATSFIRISVDGGRKIYPYFRTGEWNKLEDNLKTFRKYNKKTTLEATCTISAFQILDLKNTIIDMYSLPVDKLHKSFVQYPKYLDPIILKSRFLTDIYKDLSYLDSYFNEFSELGLKRKTAYEILEHVRFLFQQNESNESDYQSFLYFIDRTDKIKNQNFDNCFRWTKEDLKNKPIEKKYFCIAPWVHVAQNVGGRLKPCCRFADVNDYFEKSNYSDINGFFYGNDMENLRAKMLLNQPIDNCKKCYSQEDAGKFSLRQELNSNFGYDTNEKHIKYLELGLSNACNLKCVSCASNYSTSWYEDDKILVQEGFDRPIAKEKFIVTNIDYDAINLSKLEKVKLLGGEPFMEPRNLDFFRYLNKIKKLSNLELVVVTNGTIWPNEEWLEYLKKLSQLNITISIDGINEIAEFCRYGTDWNKFDANVTKWKIFCAKNNFKMQFHSVLHAINAPYVRNISSYKFNNHKEIDINYDCLVKPEYLSIAYLPNDVKQVIESKINDSMSKVYMKKFCINYLYSKEFSEEKFAQFKKYMRLISKIRRLNMPDFWEEYFKNETASKF